MTLIRSLKILTAPIFLSIFTKKPGKLQEPEKEAGGKSYRFNNKWEGEKKVASREVSFHMLNEIIIVLQKCYIRRYYCHYIKGRNKTYSEGYWEHIMR